MESAGLYNQHLLLTNVNSRLTSKISLFGTYSLAYARSNTDGLNTFPANQYSMAGEYGPASNDVRNRMSLGGSITSKFGLLWNPFVILQSGAPFNITTSQDIYNDTVLTARPGFATNPNQPGVIATPYGLFDPDPTPGEKIVPRNYARGPGEFSVNLRLSRTFVYREHNKLTLSVFVAESAKSSEPGSDRHISIRRCSGNPTTAVAMARTKTARITAGSSFRLDLRSRRVALRTRVVRNAMRLGV